MVNYHKLTQLLLADIAEQLGMDLSRDLVTLDSRVKSEGLSFLTKTLPRMGKDLDSYHSCGKAPTWTGFSRTKDGLPKFLQGPIGLVYPTVRSAQALKSLRQLFYLFYKLEQPFDTHQIAEHSEAFRLTDESLDLSLDRVDPVLDTATRLVSQVLHRFDKQRCLPKHGPGSTAEGIHHERKMDSLHAFQTCEEEFPYLEWCVPSLSAVCDLYHSYLSRESLPYGTAKVLFVPKDSRGPRVISCEPSTLQYLQQGIKAEMVRCIETNPLSRGRVNFADQTKNQRYARWGSLGAGWATLDMKDASDRVSLALVRRIFSGTHVLPLMLATRSQATRLPDGSLVHLRKFAPMGSALCFPTLALTIWALASSVLVNHCGLPEEAATSTVMVYGDDIICRLEVYEALLQYFPTVGLMFNQGKCCVSGQFRESCGLDVFNGIDVTPIKVRKPWVLSPKKNSIGNVPSWCAYQRALWSAGYHRTADAVRGWIEEYLWSKGHRVPTLEEPVKRPSNVPVKLTLYNAPAWQKRKRDSQELCLSTSEEGISFLYLFGGSSNLDTFKHRWNAKLHRTEVRCLCTCPKPVSGSLGGYARLHWFLTGTVFDERREACGMTNEDDLLFPVRYQVTHMYRWCGKPHGDLRVPTLG